MTPSETVVIVLTLLSLAHFCLLIRNALGDHHS